VSRVLVTGGSGRLGRYIVPELARHYEVVNFDSLEPTDTSVEFIQGDITKPKDLVAATKDVDSIVHLAGIWIYTGDDANIFDVNVYGTFNVLEAAKANRIKNLVFTSSVCAWGIIFKSGVFRPAYLPADEKTPDVPDDMYGLSKVLGEQLCRAYSSRYGINCVALRLATALLPDYPPHWKEYIENIENPEYRITDVPYTMDHFFWQYVDPRDLPQAYMLSLKALEEGRVEFEVYNIGAPDIFSAVETLQLIGRYYPDVTHIDNSRGFLSEKYPPLFDITKAKTELGYDPKFTWRDFGVR
jgi:nucleoside-diphosphate-sugar epimerase